MTEYAIVRDGALIRIELRSSPPSLSAAKAQKWHPVERITVGTQTLPWTVASTTQALVDGVWTITTTHTWRPDLGPALAAAIDAGAEAARLRFITPGSGQALEYQRSIEEARALTAAGGTPDPADYPMLAAEVAALDAAGIAASLAEVAAEVVARDAAWQQAGAAIKTLRRTAKLLAAAAIAAEDPAAAIAAASGIDWPEPQ